MKNIFKLIANLTALISIIFTFQIQAQDTVIIQTLKFDSLSGRRGIWKFPNNNDSYRKILMHYTLKCDPKTPWDDFNCGEWDYLTYNMINIHTGVWDSTRQTAFSPKVGNSYPLSIGLRNNPTYTTYQRNKYSMVYEKVDSVKAMQFGSGSKTLELKSIPTRLQFIISKNELTVSNFPKGLINKMKLQTIGIGGTLANFTVKMKAYSGSDLPVFDNSSFTTCYSNNLTLKSDDTTDIGFTAPINRITITGVIIDISYDSIIGGKSIFIAGIDTAKSVFASGKTNYLEFNGDYEYVDCGIFPALQNSSAFSLEAWVKFDSWQAGRTILGKAGRVSLETGSQQGVVNCIIRNPKNSLGASPALLKLGEWTHLAMVYDGSQSSNDNKLKLFINGKPVTLSFRRQKDNSGMGIIPIPSATDSAYTPFSFSAGSSITGGLSNVHLWSVPLDAATISNWFTKQPDASHPNFIALAANYKLDESNGLSAKDYSTNNIAGKLIGVPVWKSLAGSELSNNSSTINFRPNIVLVQGFYKSRIDTSIVEEQVENHKTMVELLQITNGKPVRKELKYGWKSGWQFKYSPTGAKIDSTNYPADETLKQDTLVYYNRFEKMDSYEIGRYITPYGINFDLGPNGFTWIYDVTDYAPLLRGDVDLSAGNSQELIDVKFIMIKGTPPRNVLDVTRLWGGMKSYSYADLSNDKALSAKPVTFDGNAKQFKVKTRLSGHGHNSNDGNYPHCCEWKDNIHYLYVNKEEAAYWHIFQYYDCAENPNQAQGGTWPGSREGWCPGDIVKDYEFEVTKFIKGGSATFDYDITKVPTDNLGMGGGNYVTNMDLIQYSAENFKNDAEIYDIIAPNNFPLYSLSNPLCSQPKIAVRNNGSAPINSMQIDYWVSGGNKYKYDWKSDESSPILPHQKSEIYLPGDGNKFWIGNSKNLFYVVINNINGSKDDYQANDTAVTKFNMPDLLKQGVVLWYKTNKRAYDYILEIKDATGKVMLSKENLNNETLYKDTLKFGMGCYTLDMVDPNNLGLSYWAYTAQGTGYLQLRDLKGNLIKTFNPDFGHQIHYGFQLDDFYLVQENNYNNLLSLYPNPASDRLHLFISYPIGTAVMKLFDESGRVVLTKQIMAGEEFEMELNVAGLVSGAYFIRIANNQYEIRKNFIKR
ncbi:MAG: hypothetical protein HW421_1124 [Ignavibacteria bacterium]|nr:hypothetical protein [Ignavibacteria bacterium]